MNLQEKFIEEKGLQSDYVKWLESKVETGIEPDEEPVKKTFMKEYFYINKYLEETRRKGYPNYEIDIDYDANDLSYTTQVIFPVDLSDSEKEVAEKIINYWSSIPYVSVEGNYGIEWETIHDCSVANISIDFTKSASDDYMGREILEKLAEWLWHGTPFRRNRTRKYEAVIKPIIVRADNV